MRPDRPARPLTGEYAEAHERQLPEDYAPVELTDDRQPYEWKTRWPDSRARSKIRREAWYLAFLLFLVPVALVLLLLLRELLPEIFLSDTQQALKNIPSLHVPLPAP